VSRAISGCRQVEADDAGDDQPEAEQLQGGGGLTEGDDADRGDQRFHRGVSYSA
jgi:hypothetical protein